MGAAVVRAYGLDEQHHREVKRAIDERYRAEVVAHFRAATLWPLVDGLLRDRVGGRSSCSGRCSARRGGSPSGGSRRSCSWPTSSCTSSRTSPRSTARRRPRSPAGGRSSRCSTCRSRSWSRSPGVALPLGRALGRGRRRPLRYRDGPRGAARHHARRSPAGAHVAIVGRDRLRQDDVREAALAARRPDRGPDRASAASTCARSRPASRRRAIRMVPQDGFLFDTTVRENVRYGRDGRDRPRDRGRVRGARARRLGRRRCRDGLETAGRASAARRCRWASASSSRSCARRSATPAC